MKLTSLAKRVLLALHGYDDERAYWDRRWKLKVDPVDQAYHDRLKGKVGQLMQEHDCKNVLEVGCGQAWLRTLPGYLGLDFSLEAFKANGLSEFVVADITKRVPLLDKSFDCVVSMGVLMHIKPSRIVVACNELMRVTRKLIVLQESTIEPAQKKCSDVHCYLHDYDLLFRDFSGKVLML
jgi:hypothetical protein